MKDTNEAALLAKAKEQLIADMKEREIGAIIWNNGEAGFHFIPEIMHRSDRKDEDRVARVTGLYRYDGTLYAIEEDRADVHVSQFYTPGVDVPPVVVTLTDAMARETLGDPEAVKGYTTQGTVQEWLTIADCYFEAINEK